MANKSNKASAKRKKKNIDLTGYNIETLFINNKIDPIIERMQLIRYLKSWISR
jgi:hypothetical protein